MSNVASELPYDIVYASSTDYAPIFPSAVELMLMQAAPGALPVRWMSSKSCSYPQEIGLILSTRAYVKSIRIVTHLLFAPSKGTAAPQHASSHVIAVVLVEVSASDDTRVQRYMDHNTSTATKDIQLVRGGNMTIQCSSMDWPCAGTNARPTDIRMDIHEPLNVLKFMLHAPRAVQHATMVKASCIQQEDYDRAKDLATRIASLIDLGKQIHAIATLKTHAVAMEAFDQAQMYHMVIPYFMACAGSPVWNIRRACVEIAEQHVAILVHVFDVETLYEMYIELVRTTFLVDPTIPVLIATLHLVRTMYERPCIERIIDAIFQCSAYFNTLLREDCIRTVRFLAQQPHVAGLALECTWQRTVQVSPGFERVLGLTFLQDQLQNILCLAMESSLSFNEPSKAMGQLYEDMSAFLTSTVITTDDTVRGAALECLSLVHACQQRDFRGVVAISREVHVPLFRSFPFSDAEADRLVDQAQVFANSHQLPVQLATYELDAPGLDGFHEFHQLKKGTVAFAGQVSPRLIVEKAVSSPVKPLAGRKNQVAPATTLDIPPSSVSVNGTPRTARERIETLQVVAEVAKKVTHADDKKAGCSIS
ncbi:hypothetical protein DYB25_001540 [Aphanomyces astaci]|uniref:Uncharacterized protein n=2 Tax=Aphanomyces astaci TaxID=112090 RepID=A0A397BQW9_APHAT|nr:hypothetical protein DYB25_001540 [Aphanomyces astaci]